MPIEERGNTIKVPICNVSQRMHHTFTNVIFEIKTNDLNACVCTRVCARACMCGGQKFLLLQAHFKYSKIIFKIQHSGITGGHDTDSIFTRALTPKI